MHFNTIIIFTLIEIFGTYSEKEFLNVIEFCEIHLVIVK